MIRLMKQLGFGLTLAGYLLATVAAALHGHDHAHAHFDLTQAVVDEHAGCSHSCHAHPHAVDDHDHSGEPGHHHHNGRPEHHDDCVICQFHLAKTISTAVTTVEGLPEAVRLPQPESVVRPAAPLPSLPLSRGPPA